MLTRRGPGGDGSGRPPRRRTRPDGLAGRHAPGAADRRAAQPPDAYLDRYAEPDKGWTDRDEARWPVPYWHIDTGMASLLMLLGAVDEGLGACFFGIPPEHDAGVPLGVRGARRVHADRRDDHRLPGSRHEVAVARTGPPQSQTVVHRGHWGAAPFVTTLGVGSVAPGGTLTGRGVRVMIFKAVRDGAPYPEHRLTLKQWAEIPPRPVRLDQLITTKRELALDKLLAEDSTFYGDLFPHVVRVGGRVLPGGRPAPRPARGAAAAHLHPRPSPGPREPGCVPELSCHVSLPTRHPLDLLDVDALLLRGGAAIRAVVRRLVDDHVRPNVADWYERGQVPVRDLAKEFAAVGLLGMHLTGYGCAGSAPWPTGWPAWSWRPATRACAAWSASRAPWRCSRSGGTAPTSRRTAGCPAWRPAISSAASA